MSDALDSMLGIIPVVAVAGVSVKMVDSLFNDAKPKRKRKCNKNQIYLRKAHKLLGV
jgi:hypothetical protein